MIKFNFSSDNISATSGTLRQNGFDSYKLSPVGSHYNFGDALAEYLPYNGTFMSMPTTTDIANKVAESRSAIEDIITTETNTLSTSIDNTVGLVEEYGTVADALGNAAMYSLNIDNGGVITGYEMGSIVTPSQSQSSYFAISADTFMVGRSYDLSDPDEAAKAADPDAPDFATMWVEEPNGDITPTPAFTIDAKDDINEGYDITFNGQAVFQNLVKDNGETVIDGGYLTTDVINAHQLVVRGINQSLSVPMGFGTFPQYYDINKEATDEVNAVYVFNLPTFSDVDTWDTMAGNSEYSDYVLKTGDTYVDGTGTQLTYSLVKDKWESVASGVLNQAIVMLGTFPQTIDTIEYLSPTTEWFAALPETDTFYDYVTTTGDLYYNSDEATTYRFENGAWVNTNVLLNTVQITGSTVMKYSKDWIDDNTILPEPAEATLYASRAGIAGTGTWYYHDGTDFVDTDTVDELQEFTGLDFMVIPHDSGIWVDDSNADPELWTNRGAIRIKYELDGYTDETVITKLYDAADGLDASSNWTEFVYSSSVSEFPVGYTAEQYATDVVNVINPNEIEYRTGWTDDFSTLGSGAIYASKSVWVPSQADQAIYVLDSFTEPKQWNGEGGLTVRQTNQSCTLSQNDDKTFNVVGTANTITVSEGTTDLTYSENSEVGTWKVVSTTSSDVDSDTEADIVFAAHTNGAFPDLISVGSWSTMGILTHVLEVVTSNGDTKNIEVKQTVSKSYRGYSSKTLNLKASQLFFATESSVTSPSSISITAENQNLVEPVVYAWSKDGVGIAGATSVLVVPSDDVLVGSSSTYSCTATDNESSEVYDKISIYHVKNGEDSYIVESSNQSHMVGVEIDGTPVLGAFNNATTTLTVFKGIEDVTNEATFSWVLTDMTADIVDSNVISATGISADNAIAKCTITIEGVELTSDFKLLKGHPGSSSRSVDVHSDVTKFLTDKDGLVTPAEGITITTTVQNIIGSSQYAWYVDGVLDSTNTGDSYYIASMAPDTGTTYECVVTDTYDGVTFKDSITINHLANGVDTVNVLLNNPIHSISCDEYGVPLDGAFAGASTTLTVLRGSDDVTATSSFIWSTSNVAGTANNATYTITGIDDEVDFGYVSCVVTLVDGTTTIPISIKVQKSNKGVTGELGTAKVKGIAFHRTTATTVGTPAGGTYDSPTPTTTGWYDGVPTGEAPLWMSTCVFSYDYVELSSSSEGWTAPRKVSSVGDGTKVQFSANNTNWHDTASTNDLYMRSGTSVDGGTTWDYSGSVKIKGETGDSGTSYYITSSNGIVFRSGSVTSTTLYAKQLVNGVISTAPSNIDLYINGSNKGSSETIYNSNVDGTLLVELKDSNGNIYDDATLVDTDDFDGADGAAGSSVNIIFRRSTSDLSNSAPGSSTGVPSGWSNDPEGATDIGTLWACKGTTSVGSTTYVWNDPYRIETDSIVEVYAYRKNSSSDASGGSYNFSTNTLSAPANWLSNPEDVTDDGDKIYVMAGTAEGYAGEASANISWGTPVVYTSKIDGIDSSYGFIEVDGPLTWTRGVDQTTWSPTDSYTDIHCTIVIEGVETVRDAVRLTRDSEGKFTASNITHTGENLSSATISYVGLNTSACTVTFTYGGISVTEGVLSSVAGEEGLSAYQVWLNGGNSGTEADFLTSLESTVAGPDGQSTNIVFYKSATQPATPPSTAAEPGDWKDNPADALGTGYMWASTGTSTNGTVWSWTLPVQMEGTEGTGYVEVRIYNRATSSSTPADSSYDFANKTIVNMPSGWGPTPPTGTNPVWVSVAVASTEDTTLNWSTSTQLVKNGITETINTQTRGSKIAYYTNATGSNPTALAASTIASYWDSAQGTSTAEVDGDQIIVTNPDPDTGWTYIYEFNVEWEGATASHIHGNTVVEGTLVSKHLATGTIDASKLVVGTRGFSEIVYDFTSKTIDQVRDDFYMSSADSNLEVSIDSVKGLKVGNGSGNDELWFVMNQSLELVTDTAYTIDVEVYQDSGSGATTYTGFAGRDSTDTVWVNSSGSNSLASSYYVYGTVPTLDTWTTVGTVATGSYVVKNGITTTNNALTGTKTAAHANAKYLRPILIVNYNDVSAVCYIKSMTIRQLSNTSQTTIDGGKITTGTITQNNYNASDNTKNSKWNLDTGEFVTHSTNGTFVLDSTAEGTKFDPTIYGGYIKGSTIEGTTIVHLNNYGKLCNISITEFYVPTSVGTIYLPFCLGASQKDTNKRLNTSGTLTCIDFTNTIPDCPILPFYTLIFQVSNIASGETVILDVLAGSAILATDTFSATAEKTLPGLFSFYSSFCSASSTMSIGILRKTDLSNITNNSTIDGDVVIRISKGTASNATFSPIPITVFVQNSL